jgi:hypothetical protein
MDQIAWLNKKRKIKKNLLHTLLQSLPIQILVILVHKLLKSLLSLQSDIMLNYPTIPIPLVCVIR